MDNQKDYINISETESSKESSNTSKPDFSLTSEVSVCWKIPLKDRVKFLLASKGMTQSEYADLIGINKGTISKILNGFWTPTSKIKILMGKHLGVDSLVLFGDQQYFLDYKLTIQKARGGMAYET